MEKTPRGSYYFYHDSKCPFRWDFSLSISIYFPSYISPSSSLFPYLPPPPSLSLSLSPLQLWLSLSPQMYVRIRIIDWECLSDCPLAFGSIGAYIIKLRFVSKLEVFRTGAACEAGNTHSPGTSSLTSFLELVFVLVCIPCPLRYWSCSFFLHWMSFSMRLFCNDPLVGTDYWFVQIWNIHKKTKEMLARMF